MPDTRTVEGKRKRKPKHIPWTLIPEDADERRMFNQNLETFQVPNAIRSAAFTLKTYYDFENTDGSYKHSLAVLANECGKASDELVALNAERADLMKALEEAKAILEDPENGNRRDQALDVIDAALASKSGEKNA